MILIGFMGVGKTSVSRVLSQRLDVPFIDLDDQIQVSHGDISDIINTQGELSFRGLEFDALCLAIDGPVGVISTGGGIVTHVPSRVVLETSNCVVWLQAAFETVSARIQQDKLIQRPLADAQLQQRYHDRQEWYAQCASVSVCVDDLTVEEVAEKIINRYA